MNLTYTADAVPGQASPPWQMLGQGTESASGGILTLGGTRQAYRVEDLGGLSHAFSMTARVRLVPGSSGAFAVGAVAQTKAAVFVLAAAPGGMSVALLGDKQVTTIGTVPFDATTWHTVAVQVVRGVSARFIVDGDTDHAVVIDWNGLPGLDASPAYGHLVTTPDQMLVLFGSIGGYESQWDDVDASVCGPVDLAVSVQTEVPSQAGRRVLPGGMGETLSGMTSLTATVTRVDVVHRTVLDDPSTERVITVSASPADVTLATTPDDTSVRPLTGLEVPPGYVMQLRLIVRELRITLRGQTYPVAVPSGAESGLKVVPAGGYLRVPENGGAGIVIGLPLFGSLARNRKGFRMRPLMRACDCVFDPATETCSLGGTSGAPVCPGPGGGPPVVSHPVLTSLACNGPVAVPLRFDTVDWIDGNVHTPQPGGVLYDPGVNLPVAIAADPATIGLGLDVTRIDLRVAAHGPPDTATFGGTPIRAVGNTAVAAARMGIAVLQFHSEHVPAGALPGTWPTGRGLSVGSAWVDCDPKAPLYPSVPDMPLLQAVTPLVVALRGTHDLVLMRVPADADHHQTLAMVDTGQVESPPVPSGNFSAELVAWHGDAYHADRLRRAAVFRSRSGLVTEPSSRWLDLPPSSQPWVVAIRSLRGTGSVILRRAVTWRQDLPKALNVNLAIAGVSPHPPGARKCRRLTGLDCTVCETLTHDLVFHGPDCPEQAGQPGPSGGPPPSQIEDLERALCVGLRRTYSAYKGIADVHVLRVWVGDGLCGGAGPFGSSACDVEVVNTNDRNDSYATPIQLPIRPGVHLLIGQMLPVKTADSPWLVPHELGHYLFDLCDEYGTQEPGGPVNLPLCPYQRGAPAVSVGLCGHSLMSDDFGPVRAVCTDREHGLDAPTPIRVLTQGTSATPSAWDVALCGWPPLVNAGAVQACLAEQRQAVELPSLDALDFSRSTLGGHFWLERMNYGVRRIRVCQ